MLDRSNKWWMDGFLGNSEFSVGMRGAVLALFARREALSEVDVDQVSADLGVKADDVREALRVLGEKRHDCDC